MRFRICPAGMECLTWTGHSSAYYLSHSVAAQPPLGKRGKRGRQREVLRLARFDPQEGSDRVLFGFWVIPTMFVLGALVAWAGDRIGRAVGRGRLSLLGLRPKYTSVVVAVLTGGLIALGTVLGVAAISQDARTALFGMEKIRQTIASLESDRQIRSEELRKLQATLSYSRSDLTKTQQQLSLAHESIRQLDQHIAQLTQNQAELERTNAQLQASAKAAQKEIAELADERKTLLAQKSALEKQRASLQSQIAQLTDRMGNLQQYSSRLFGDLYKYFVDFREGNVAIKAGEPLVYGVATPQRGKEWVRQFLQYLLSWAAQEAKRRGAAPNADGNILLLNVLSIESQNGAQPPTPRILSLDEILDRVTAAIMSRPDVSSVVVQIYSVANSLQGEPASVDFSLIVNRRLFQAGQQLLSVTVDGRQSEAAVFETLYAAVSRRLEELAREQGLLLPAHGAAFDLDQVFSAMNRVAQIKGPARVDVQAAADIWTAGPIRLGFVVTPSQ